MAHFVVIVNDVMSDNMAAFAHVGDRLGAFFYWTMFRKQCTVRQYTTLIYLINLLGKLVLGVWLDSELHYFSIFTENKTRNSSGDEIANVNFLYDDILHALKIQ